MQNRIISELAAYLEAMPAQVRLWGGHVVEQLAAQPALFSRFQQEGASGKWSIYHGLRYGGLCYGGLRYGGLA